MKRLFVLGLLFFTFDCYGVRDPNDPKKVRARKMVKRKKEEIRQFFRLQGTLSHKKRLLRHVIMREEGVSRYDVNVRSLASCINWQARKFRH